MSKTEWISTTWSMTNGDVGGSHERQHKTHLSLKISQVLQEMFLGQLAESLGLRDHLVKETDFCGKGEGRGRRKHSRS